MAVTGTKTVRDMVTSGLIKAGILGIGEAASHEDAEQAMGELNLMLKSWQNEGYQLWTSTSASHTMTAGAVQTLDPVRPLELLNARFKRSATASEIPMISLTRNEYDELPNKASTGTPTQFYYDRQRENARLYVWPVLSTVTAQTIEYSYTREQEDITSLTEALDIPGEWWEATVYNLAVRLNETVPGTSMSQMVPLRAERLLDDALAFDREGSVFFCGGTEC